MLSNTTLLVFLLAFLSFHSLSAAQECTSTEVTGDCVGIFPNNNGTYSSSRLFLTSAEQTARQQYLDSSSHKSPMCEENYVRYVCTVFTDWCGANRTDLKPCFSLCAAFAMTCDCTPRDETLATCGNISLYAAEGEPCVSEVPIPDELPDYCHDSESSEASGLIIPLTGLFFLLAQNF